MKVYRIRNKLTGLFCAGGGGPTWEKFGIVYSSIAHLESHFRAIKRPLDVHKDSEIVVYNLIEHSIMEVAAVIREVTEEKARKEAHRREIDARYRRDYELEQLRKLAEKHNLTVVEVQG